MRLYGAISKVVPQEDGTVKVEGIASSEAEDDQGETVRADAMRAAIPDYMAFPALREMHQLSAAGTTLEAECDDDGMTRIVAHVVDPIAVTKVKTQTYRGFSIGGRVTKRDPGNAKIITGLSLSEISLVDRPANPEAVFDCWKSSTPLEGTEMSGLATIGETPAGEKLAAALNPPVQIWTCNDPEHRHIAKAEAVQCCEDMAKAATTEPDPEADEAAVAEPDAQPGAQETLDAAREALERSKRALEEPEDDAAKSAADPAAAEVTAELPAAADESAKTDGPQGRWRRSAAPDTATAAEAFTKSLYTVQDLAGVIMFLDNMCADLRWEAMIEGDNSGAPDGAKALLASACAFLRSQVAEETAEIMAGTDIEYGEDDDGMMMASVGATLQKMAERAIELSSTENPGQFDELAAALVKAGARHSAQDQMMLDTAFECCSKCIRTASVTKTITDNLGEACKSMAAAGAKGWASPAEKASGMAIDALAKAGSHQALMDMAHDCLERMTRGAVCGSTAKANTRHSRETIVHLTTAHAKLCAAGAGCDAAEEGADDKVAASETDDLAKLRRDNEALIAEVDSERTQKAAFNALLSEIMPTLDRLTKKVEAIAETPIAPMAVVRVDGGITKASDGSSTAPTIGGGQDLSPEAVALALSKMSQEEQTLTLIKASYARPRELKTFGGVPQPFTPPTN